MAAAPASSGSCAAAGTLSPVRRAFFFWLVLLLTVGSGCLIFLLNQASISALAPRGSTSHYPTTTTHHHAPAHYFDAATRSLRRQLFLEVCSDASKTSTSGAWCLFPTNTTIAGRPYTLPKFHLPADRGIAATVMTIFKRNQRVLDLGCGVGQYGHFFNASGADFRWEGYDGAINVEEYTHGYVKWADLSVPGFVADDHAYHGNRPDWVMALEIGEHVPAESMEVLIDNIAANNRCGAIVSWAVPGQGGHSHINELPNARIIDAFVGRGYSYNAEKSEQGRRAAVYWWFQNSFMVFDRLERPPEGC